MLLGGIPKYLDLVREKPSIRIGIEELAFTETGYLVDEYDRIFLSHFGRNLEYEKIVRRIILSIQQPWYLLIKYIIIGQFGFLKNF